MFNQYENGGKMPVITIKRNVCECGVDLPYNPQSTKQVKYCDTCREKHRLASLERAKAHKADYQRRYKAKEKAALTKPMPTAKPKPRPTSVMTDAQQAKIDRECRARDIERRGLLTSPGRSLSPAEIEAIKSQITPPDKITNFEPGFNATF